MGEGRRHAVIMRSPSGAAISDDGKYITMRTGMRAANAYATSVFPKDRQPRPGTNADPNISTSARA